MKTSILSLLMLGMVACGSTRSVPTSALSAVPTAEIPGLVAQQEAVAQATVERDRLEESVASTEVQLEKAERAAKEATVDLSATVDARAMAVSIGDQQGAKALADDLESARERESRRGLRVVRLEQQLELQKARLEAAKKDVVLQTARLEHLRAEAAVKGGADLKTRPFVEQLAAAENAYDDAVADVEALE